MVEVRSIRRVSPISRGAAYTVLFILLIIVLFPFAWMVLTSVKTQDQMRTLTTPFWPNPLTWANYEELLRRQPFGTWFFNSSFVATISTILAVMIGSTGAYALTRLRFRGRALLSSVVLITYLVPPTILFIPLYSIVRTLGLQDNLAGLIAVYPTFTVPFATWTLMSFFESVPRELDEAALIDGCNHWIAFWRVSLPLISPGVVAAAMFAFTLSWNEFLYAFVFISNPKQATLPVSISKLIQGDVYLWGQLMAAATLTTLPVVVMYIYLQRYMVEGLTAGSIKG